MQMVAEILQYLVQRPEDFLENVEITVKLYKELLLSALEVRALLKWWRFFKGL